MNGFDKLKQKEYNSAAMNFKEYINEKLLAVAGREGKSHATSADIACALGLSTKVFQEILNGRRSGPDRRDLVIALCAELGLDAEETDEALKKYPGYLRRLSEDDARDRAIKDFLNAGFDTEISYNALNSFLCEVGHAGLKIRYRSPSQNDCERSTAMKKIDWSTKPGSISNKYHFYTALGYDDVTASVLALFTYGEKRILEFSMQDAYEALAEGKSYPLPPPPPPKPDVPVRPFTRPMADYCLEDLGDDVDACLAPSNFNMLKRPSLARADKATFPSSPALSSMAFMELDDAELADFEFDDYEPIEEKGHQELINSATSTFRMTTNTASVGIVLNQLRNNRGISRDMVRIEEWLNYYRYMVEKPKDETFRISHEIKDLDFGKKLVYINVQGKEQEKQPQNIVLLLDVSGSMSSEASITQATIATIVSKLKKGSTLSLVTYGPGDEVILDGFKIESYESKVHILEKLLGLEIDGYTYGSAGIERAYKVGKQNYIPGGNNQVILITDGDLNFGIVSKGGLEKLIEEEKKSNLFLSVLGMGLTDFKDDKLEVLSKHGNGVYRVVNNINDVKKCVRDEFASLVNIIAKDVKAQVEFNPAIVKSYRLLGFENRGLNHSDFKDDTVISEPFGSGGYGVALYELIMKESDTAASSELKYRKVVLTDSEELATVKLRYKEPLDDNSYEIEYIIPTDQEHYSDNLLLAWIIYVCAEKLRDSDKIAERDIALALAAFDELGKEIKLMNFDEIDKLREILRRTKKQLKVGNDISRPFDW